jgi:hypothetical protein
MGSGVAALSVAACPPANATAPDAHAASKTRAVVRHERVKPRLGHVRTAQGEYVYKVIVGGEVRTDKANMACSGSSLRISGVTAYPESRDATSLWERSPAAWRQRFTITSGPATTITVPWSSPGEDKEAAENGGMIPNSRSLVSTTQASRVCAATTPNAAVGSMGEGVVTWSLPSPAKSVAALLAHAPTNVSINEYVSAFTIQPDGTVPTFGAGS